MRYMRYICALFILVASLSLYSCGEDSPTVPNKEEFVSFLTGLGTVSNGKEPFIGLSLWDFTKDGKVFRRTLDSGFNSSFLTQNPDIRLFIIHLLGGTYTLSPKTEQKGEYIASCRFIIKESRIAESRIFADVVKDPFSGRLVSQWTYDEKEDVRLKKDGDALLINDVKFEKL